SPPIHMLLRTTNEEVTMSGGGIPKDALVATCIGAANRDPRQFKDPDRFDIHRTDLDLERALAPSANHPAVRLGGRLCLGPALARGGRGPRRTLRPDRGAGVGYVDGRSPPERGLLSRSPRTLPVTFTARPR